MENKLFIKIVSWKLALAFLNFVSIFTFQYNLLCTYTHTHSHVQLLLGILKILMVFLLSLLISITFWQLTAFKIHVILSPTVKKKKKKN